MRLREWPKRGYHFDVDDVHVYNTEPVGTYAEGKELLSYFEQGCSVYY